MLKIGDKIKYVKANPFIEIPIGTVMTVTDIKGVAVAVEANCKVGMYNATVQGVMSYDEVEKYFEKTIKETDKKQNVWTDWQTVPSAMSEIIKCLEKNTSCTDCPCYYSCEYEDNIEYKTNNKKIMVRLKTEENKYIKSYATCHRTDTFDLNTGLTVALARLNVKIAQEKLIGVIKEIG